MKLFLTLILLVPLVGCVDDCPDGVCPRPEATTSPFVDPPTYQPAPPRPAWQVDTSSLGKEVSISPSLLVNTDAATESKFGWPNQRTLIQPTYRYVQPATSTSVPWQSHQLIGPPIRLNPGETLLRINPPMTNSVPQAAVGKTMPKANSKPCDCTDCACPDCDCPPSVLMPPNCLNGKCPQPVADSKPNDVREGVFVCQRCRKSTVGDQWHELWSADDVSLTCLCESCWQVLTPNQRTVELVKYARDNIVGGLSPIVTDAIREAVNQ